MENKILINYRYSINDTYPYVFNEKRFYFKYDNNTTFGDLARKLDLDEYPLVIKTHNSAEGIMYYFYRFDYIYGENEIKWDEDIYNTKIKDYLRTFKCDCISIEKATGGIGETWAPTQIAKVVESIIECLKEISNAGNFCTGLGFFIKLGINIKRYVKKYRNREKYIDSNKYLYSILLSNDWDIHDFMAKYELNYDESVKMLRSIGYKYIKSRNVYHISLQQKKISLGIIEKINTNKAKAYQ